MKRDKHACSRKFSTKHSLNLPDLDQAKSTALNSLASKESQRTVPNRGYRSIERLSPAIEFTWNRASLRRARSTAGPRPLGASHMKPLIPVCSARTLPPTSGESRGIRTLASACGTGSPLTRQGLSGRCLTPTLSNKRDRALLAILLGCGLRRKEEAELELSHLQRREDHWAIVDLIGKGRHHSDRARSELGQERHRYMARFGRRERRPSVWVRLPRRQDLGNRRNRTGGVACREGLRPIERPLRI